MKKYFSFIFVAVVLIILIIVLCVFSPFRQYALKIDNKKISVSEFKAYLYEQKKEFEEKGGEDIWETDFDGAAPQEIAKQNAINSIILVKTAVKQANKLGITLSAEEKASVKVRGKNYYDKIHQEAPSVAISLSEAEKIAQESMLEQKVYDYVTKGFEISEGDFELFFNEYYEQHKNELNDVEVQYIYKEISDDESVENFNAQAEAVYERLLSGEDFAAVQAEVSDGDMGILKVEDLNLTAKLEDAAYNLKEGEISEILYSEFGFYILKAHKIQTPDMNILKSELRETYTSQRKSDIYQSQLSKWSEDISVEKNEKVCNEINIDDIM